MPERIPSRVKVPAETPSAASEASRTEPALLLLPLMPSKTPAPANPVPERTRDSVPMAMPPASSKAAPAVTVVPARVPPRASAFSRRKVPPNTKVSPAKVFAVWRVTRAVPYLLRPPTPAKEPVPEST